MNLLETINFFATDLFSHFDKNINELIEGDVLGVLKLKAKNLDVHYHPKQKKINNPN